MVTIKEIAKAVGVSATTVSRVLNYDETLSVSPTKRQAIIETAEAMNYATPRNRNRIQNGAAIASDRIAMLHFLAPEEEVADPYYVGVRLGIERRCRAAKLEIDKIYAGDSLAEESDLRSLSGAVVIGRHARETIIRVGQCVPHVVFADFAPVGEEFDCVYSDLGFATTQLLDSLFLAGYRSFAFIGVEECVVDFPVSDQRYPAYVAWSRSKGLFRPESCLLGDLRVASGYELTRQLLDLSPVPEIIVTSNDNMAIGAYRAIAERGWSIPGDVAVASFNDIPVAQFLSPPLSSMRIRAEHIGETAVDLLVERLGGRDFAKRVVIATEMIWRDSCRNPPR
jgi:LacI family transcriptional regulator